ncbi:hypothetical protein ACO9S2_09980 [Nitrospira sp. NS4]|uniref:hypothetical protein n=1 Tax=Nitrospira sp. NS4 TaxID=3414498 RepID=UPI003C2F6275
MLNQMLSFTEEETALLSDAQFFRKKAQIMAKVRGLLDATHIAVTDEMRQADLITPPDFNPRACQFVKGEHLESFPYQYLDCPKHFHGGSTFTFRTLFWWGHHLACALMLEGTGIKQYKRHIVDRFHQVAGQELELSIAPTLWEWKRGEGYTLPITHNRKAQIAAVLAERRFLKIVRFVPMTDPRLQAGQLPDLSRETFRAILPIVSA